MPTKELPFEIRLKTGRYDEAAIRAELNGLKSTDAYKNVMNDIDGKLPRALKFGQHSNLQKIVITDYDEYEGPNSLNPASSRVSNDAEWLIYLNPNKLKIDPETGRVMTVGEVLIHELGHATTDGIAAIVKGMYGALTGATNTAGEVIANRYERQLTDERGLKPIPLEHSNNSIRNFGANEKPNYFTKIDPGCFLAGTSIILGNNAAKNISEIRPGDIVKCYDSSVKNSPAKLAKRKVSNVFTNVAKIIIDLRGLRCTPGHVFLTGETDANGHGRFDTIANILRHDGTLVEQDATIIRARTGARIGQADDALVNVAFRDPPVDGREGPERHVLVRAGIPLPSVMIKDSLAPAQSLARHLADHGITPLADGRLRTPDGAVHDACNWPEGTTPFDSHEARNWIVQADGRPYCPPWIRDLVAEDETEGLRVVDALSA